MPYGSDKMSIRAEALRLMGIFAHEPDLRSSQMLDEVIDALEAVSSFRYTALRADMSLMGAAVDFGIMRLESADLSKHLEGCFEGFIFAATLGAGPDRLMSRYALTDISRASALQAAAAALLEHKADEAQQALESGLCGVSLTSRFSPGYGDLSLACQGRMLEVLDAGRRIGLYCTKRAMLTPTKSITAIIGIREGSKKAQRTGCTACAKAGCAYRRENS